MAAMIANDSICLSLHLFVLRNFLHWFEQFLLFRENPVFSDRLGRKIRFG